MNNDLQDATRRGILASAAGIALIAVTASASGAPAPVEPDMTVDTVVVEDFGAVGDGIADDTKALQAAIDYACAKSKTLTCASDRVYSVSTLRVRNGLVALSLAGSTIKGRGTAKDAVLVLGAAGAPVFGARVSVRMDMSGGDRIAIKGYDSVECTFTDCMISGFTNHPKLNHYGILLSGPATRNVLRANTIRGFLEPIQRGLLIDLLAGGQAEYGGFYKGEIKRATAPCVENIIEGNTLLQGSYGINMLGCEKCILRGNTCTGQNHRSIYLANASWDNLIENNKLSDYLSSAVVMGFGSSNNIVRGNKIKRSGAYAFGEAAINVNSGATHNQIIDNVIYASTNYGVYLALDVVDNVVKANVIENYYLAGVMIENDWKRPRPPGANFSRPNYAPPYSGGYSHINTADNQVIDNTFKAGYAGRETAAISIAQIDAGNGTSVTGTKIEGNKVLSSENLGYNLYVYAEDDSKLTGTVVIGNTFHAGVPSASVNSRGAASWEGRISSQGKNINFD